MERRLKPFTPDNRSIDIIDDYALEFWARELNVTYDKLKKAVRTIGTAVPDVVRELKK